MSAAAARAVFFALVLVAGCATGSGAALSADAAADRKRQATRYVDDHEVETVACFEAELEKQPRLNGHVMAHIVLRPDGAFAVADFTDANIGADSAIRACLAKVIGGWHTLPDRGAEVTLVRRLGWEPEAFPPPSEPGKVSAAISMSVVRRVVRAHDVDLKSCGPHRRIAVTIENSGRVENAKLVDASAEATDAEKCVIGRFERLRFPRPAGAGIIVVQY